MSEGDSKPGPSGSSKAGEGASGANKRRRRRRKPAGDGGSAPGGQEGGSSASSSKAGGEAGAGRSKRRRGGRGRSEKSAEGSASPQGSGSQSSRPQGSDNKRGSSDDSRRSRSRRKSGMERSGGAGAAAPKAAKSERPSKLQEPKAILKRSEEPLYDQETPAPAAVATTRWGDDSDAPTPDIKLKADLPKNAPPADWDPATSSLLETEGGYEGQLSARICNVIGVRFLPTGRIYMYDAGDGHFAIGDQVIVEGDHGQRSAMVTVSSTRRPPPRSLKRIVRRATEADIAADTGASRSEDLQRYLGVAKGKAKDLKLGIKVFRVNFEDEQQKLAVYYSCEDKTDVRPLSRALSDALPLRVDLRHTGVRDEAKLVGGIGACGQELCCTTWLPSFVPVSIKHAKDQGLALTPSKITGQCGRLKCCLVYEQENYAKLRKGLPKLGKRVITNDGFEGRVIELDVLHQRIRVSVGRGESKVYTKGEVEPMFASQAQGDSTKTTSKKKRESNSQDDNNNTGQEAGEEQGDEQI